MTTTFIPERDGYRIPAVFSSGKAAPEDGAEELVILCHGISTNKDEYLNFLIEIESLLNEKGVSTLRFDFRGHGESALPPKSFSIASQVVDLFTVVRWVHGKSPRSRISFFGVSFGAPPCLMIDKWIDDIKLGPRFLVAPVLNYSRTFLKPESPWATKSFPPVAQINALKGDPIYINDSFYMTGELFAEMEAIDVESFISSSNAHIYIMHGTEDDMVPYDISKTIADSEPGVDLISFPGMEHGFTAKGDETGRSTETLSNIENMIRIVEKGLSHAG